MNTQNQHLFAVFQQISADFQQIFAPTEFKGNFIQMALYGHLTPSQTAPKTNLPKPLGLSALSLCFSLKG